VKECKPLPRLHARITAPVFRLMWNFSDRSITCVNVRSDIFRDAYVLTYAKALSFIYGRKWKLKAKLETVLSYFTFKRCN
jgi:hypothetical protein